EGYHQSAVGHLSPFIHECRTYYLNSRSVAVMSCLKIGISDVTHRRQALFDDFLNASQGETVRKKSIFLPFFCSFCGLGLFPLWLLVVF
ncbi:hypothetical protein, partial [Aeromonas veronii]|uniref:hypothetical protein n=1 Tax=Aeromonas veronii TaxID=654 RepID=UPI0019550C27